MFPGHLKETFAQVVTARQEGLAALERARRGRECGVAQSRQRGATARRQPKSDAAARTASARRFFRQYRVLGMPAATTALPLRPGGRKNLQAGPGRGGRLTRPSDPRRYWTFRPSTPGSASGYWGFSSSSASATILAHGHVAQPVAISTEPVPGSVVGARLRKASPRRRPVVVVPELALGDVAILNFHRLVGSSILSWKRVRCSSLSMARKNLRIVIPRR